MGLADRLQERLEARGISQNELARRVGVSQPTIWKILAGRTQATAHLRKIARVLETSEEYLLGESNAPGVAVTERPQSDECADPDLVEIDMIDLSYGMGGGTFLDSDHVEVEKVSFSRSWIRQFTSSPPQFLASTRGIGDSMMPTIHDRDVVIIDKSQKRIDMSLGDKIWAIVYGGVGMIKRLRPQPDGTVKISSDNQLIRDELATDGDLFIVGRVIAKVSTL